MSNNKQIAINTVTQNQISMFMHTNVDAGRAEIEPATSESADKNCQHYMILYLFTKIYNMLDLPKIFYQGKDFAPSGMYS